MAPYHSPQSCFDQSCLECPEIRVPVVKCLSFVVGDKPEKGLEIIVTLHFTVLRSLACE